MHKIGKLGLQVFAAPDNMTGQAQIHVKAREIDFVTSFGKNIQALLDVLGIIRMIKKDNNTVLKTKKVTGTLQSGEVAEGEEIPYSQYAVEEIPFDTIRINKYRKGVTLEAIAEKGYDAAVQDTDEEFKSDLQNVVMDKLYTQLKAGSLTDHESTWQMAVAMAIGKVKDKFKKMKRTATGVAVWVNTLDVYKYVGAADITLQTAFGFEYMKKFLGAEVAKGDTLIDSLEDAMINDELVEIWEANLDDPASSGSNKFKGKYFQGYVTEVEKTSNAEDMVEVSLTFGVNGTGQKGDVTVTTAQQEIAAYVFTDKTKTGA